jgi:putative tryptophan/tyrosine transport system substrate-binding protein
MAAPERFAEMSDSSCTAGAVHTWHFSEVAALTSMSVVGGISEVGFGAVRTVFDPPRTWALPPSDPHLARIQRARLRYDTLSNAGAILRRRDFMALAGGAVAIAPFAVAQQRERMRLIGVLMPATADDPDFQARIAAFHQGLQQSGWTIGDNVRIDTRWATTDAAEIRRHAAELAALAPDVILAHAATTVGPLLQATRTVPVVFPAVVDPVGAGFVESLARPGGNATGFMNYEYSLSGKWLELLKQIAPGMTRVAVLRNAATASGPGQFAAIQAVAPSLGVEANPVNVRDAGEIESAVAAFARAPNGGLIVTASPAAALHRELIVSLAARHKLPAVYFERHFVAAGGLISYGPDQIDMYRRASGYVDRILKGEKPAGLPVQAPTKYELVINLKTAKALGLAVPQTLLGLADEVIE